MTREEARQRWADIRERRTPPPGGEETAAFQARVVAFLEETAVRHPGEKVGVVTHGGVLRMVMAHALGLPVDRRSPFDFGNCSVTVIDWADRIKIEVVNCTGELM